MRKVVSSVLHRGNFWLAYHNLRVEKIYSSALLPCHLGARSEHGAECFAFRALVAEQGIPAIETPPSEPPRASEKVEEEWERAQREPRAAVGEAYSRPGVGGCSADELLLISPLRSPPGLPGPSDWDSAVYLPNLLEGDFSEVRLSSVLGNHILCEVRSLLPKRFVQQEKCRKKTPTTSKIVANLSPVGKDVGLHAHPCAGEKGKPVVRRGRKAYGPPRARWEEVAWLPNSIGGVTESSAIREERGCGCNLTFWE